MSGVETEKLVSGRSKVRQPVVALGVVGGLWLRVGGGGDKYNLILTFFFKNLIIFPPPSPRGLSPRAERERVCVRVRKRK